MDILAHGLWVNVIYAKSIKKERWIAALLGIAPDLLSFGIFFILGLFGGFNFGPPNISQVPGYVFSLYNIWHSIFTWSVIFFLVWGILKKPYWPLLAPLIHIAIDVPLHDINFFPTPFLWPVSDYKFDGFSWGVGWFMILNYAALIIAYLAWYIIKWQKTKKVA